MEIIKPIETSFFHESSRSYIYSTQAVQFGAYFWGSVWFYSTFANITGTLCMFTSVDATDILQQVFIINGYFFWSREVNL